jgi:hypothetical protein
LPDIQFSLLSAFDLIATALINLNAKYPIKVTIIT